MLERLAILGGVALIAAAIAFAYSLYKKRAPALDRLEVGELGLELMEGCCAFVVFTSPACTPCKAALRVVGAAADEASGPTDVRAIDAGERADLVHRYDIRTVPTTFLITASGHVLRRWRDVPDAADVRAALSVV